jgi:hypothetical protein
MGGSDPHDEAPMSQLIQCPNCQKKFRLPEKPPATFPCSKCGTLMDLGAFAAAAPAAAPAAGPSTRSGSPRAGRAGPARRGGRRGEARSAPSGDEDSGRPGRRAARKQGNPALLLGSLAAFVAVVVVVIVVMNKDDGEATSTSGTSTASSGASGTPAAQPSLPTGGETPASGAGTPPAGAPASGTPASGTPSAPKEATGDTPIEKPAPEATKDPRGAGRIDWGSAQLKVFPWPDEVDKATRDRVEELLPAYMRGDRWSQDAADELVALGRPICGRLISEWKHIEEREGFESREGKSQVRAIETILRRIDGVIERLYKLDPNYRIHPSSDYKFIEGQIKRWVAWWEQGVWKKKPLEPWVEAEDGSDLSEEEKKRLLEEQKAREEEERKKAEEGGFGKRAGG